MEITAEIVKKLRDKTGAPMMDCKKALQETNGDEEKAIEYLRKKGSKVAEKRADKVANQGAIESYIHAGSRIGVLVELNCETDFVAKTEAFKNLAKEIAMQIAAMNPKYVKRDDVPKEVIDKEIEIYKTQAKSEGKPEHILQKIAEGKLDKFYADVCLLEQAFIKDPNKTIKDLIMEEIGKIGENISVKRFVRFQLGDESN
ncbi:MAG TPA: translation elongation factor Ts [Ignavibacteria bacterium]|jgi:elongation factor Ts